MPSDPAHPAMAPSPGPIDRLVRIDAIDLPIAQLTPVRKRTVKRAAFARLEANIRAVGLIEPLLVFRHQGQHFLLDGFLRYQALLGLGVVSVPCLVIDNLDLYTPNRQVNYLSRSQRWSMIKRALAEVDEETIKAALALTRLRNGLPPQTREWLCAAVQQRVQAETLSVNAARLLVHVDEARQREILALIDQAKDTSPAFIRAQILRTPVDQRTPRGKLNPWNRGLEVRKKLVDRLAEAEDRHDFYANLYRQYAGDLVKLAIYVRQIVVTKELRNHLAQHHPDEMQLFMSVVQQFAETKSAARA